ncbi:MAG: IS66 family insertion sequence element accessory protein TnpB [Bdellovibrionales bacterium]|nr:IS66 family insertion sequence element accessory protein TnpB [Bdellovibrionales bacterium]
MISGKYRVFVYGQSIDMRWGFEKLSFLIREEMKSSVDAGDLYLFLGRNRRRLKGLRFDGSGLVLFTKRMEKKRGFMSVVDLDGRGEITKQELELLIHGSVLKKYLPTGSRAS